MSKQRYRKLYTETMDRKTFNVIHIKCVTGCCMRCAKRQRREFYFIRPGELKEKAKYPSWKLTSKNKKQWMSKNLDFNKLNDHFIEITWNNNYI